MSRQERPTYELRGQGHEKARNSKCRLCRDKRKDYDTWFVCDDCNYYYHPQCQGLDPEDVLIATDSQRILCCLCRREPEPDYRNQKYVVTSSDKERAGTSGNQAELHVGQDGPNLQQDDPPNCYDDGNDQVLQDISHSTLNNSQSTCSTASSDTDDDGNSEIKSIIRAEPYGRKNEKRRFLVKFKPTKNNPSITKWVTEGYMKGCPQLLNKFCEDEGLNRTFHQEPTDKCGASNPSGNQDNWVSIDKILEAAITYGRKDSIQPTILQSKLGPIDGLFVVKIQHHCFVVLYMASSKVCIVSDGENVYSSDSVARELLLDKLQGARIFKYIPFEGQKEEDHCASSAVGIASQFQTIYKHRPGKLPMQIKVPESTMNRVRAVFHKQPGKKIKDWLPVAKIDWRVECPNCKKKFDTKNRGVLALHKCKK